MARMYYEKDVDLEVLKNKKVAVFLEITVYM